MGRSIALRALTSAEETQLTRWVRQAKTERRLADRARIILWKQQGVRTQQVAERLGCDLDVVARWVKRFNEAGLAGLVDRPGRGRKPTYNEAERSRMIVTAKTAPQTLGLPFNYWSLSRLVSYLHTEKQIAVSRAQLGRILEAEGLRWYQEQTYFTERPDPQFVEKRAQL